MKPRLRVFWLLTFSILLSGPPFAFGGTWADHFSQKELGSDWQGDREHFSILDGTLSGVSAQPVAPVPLYRVTVGKDWADYTVQCRVDVVQPNLLVCTTGALVLRDNGSEGYVFALHVATQTIEIYRLSNHEMLLIKSAPLELKRWYLLRAELSGANMSFFVDDQLVGSLNDERSLCGAAGVAVQDVMPALFDDFSVTGPDIPDNGISLSVGKQVSVAWPRSLTNFVLKATSQLAPAGIWETVTNIPSAVGDQLSVTLDSSAPSRFFLLQPKSP